MGDLDRKNSSSVTQITGADINGVETTPVKSFPTQELATAVVLDTDGVNDEITVGTSAIEAKAGVSTHPNRKVITITNSGTTKLYWGYDPATAIASPNKGDLIYKRQSVTINASTNVKIYIISDAVGGKATVLEGA